jgi:hypothetical protein
LPVSLCFPSSCVPYVASFSGFSLRLVYPMLPVSLCFSSSCVSYVASFSGFYFFDCPFSNLFRSPVILLLPLLFKQYFSYIVAVSFIGGENHRPASSHWQTLSYNVESSKHTIHFKIYYHYMKHMAW